jgi:hypothetical protein
VEKEGEVLILTHLFWMPQDSVEPPKRGGTICGNDLCVRDLGCSKYGYEFGSLDCICWAEAITSEFVYDGTFVSHGGLWGGDVDCTAHAGPVNVGVGG